MSTIRSYYTVHSSANSECTAVKTNAFLWSHFNKRECNMHLASLALSKMDFAYIYTNHYIGFRAWKAKKLYSRRLSKTWLLFNSRKCIQQFYICRSIANASMSHMELFYFGSLCKICLKMTIIVNILINIHTSRSQGIKNKSQKPKE